MWPHMVIHKNYIISKRKCHGFEHKKENCQNKCEKILPCGHK